MDLNYTKQITTAMEREALKFCDEMRRMADAISWPSDSLRRVFITHIEETLKEYTEKLVILCKYPISVAEKEQEIMQAELENFKNLFQQKDNNP